MMIYLRATLTRFLALDVLSAVALTNLTSFISFANTAARKYVAVPYIILVCMGYLIKL